jgi:hypothetical protein
MEQVTLERIRTMAREARGYIDRIFLHWSAGHYGQPFPDYHFNIDQGGEIYTPVEQLTQRLAHTWQQNSGSVAVSLLCCAFATPENFGDEPPTEAQIETMAQVVAVLCQELAIPLEYVRTHAEQANVNDYGPEQTWERWDLWFWPGVEPGQGGEVLRGKARYYMEGRV